MRVNGIWLSGEDGELRPVVPGLVRLSNGQWLEAAFLLDGGADRTVFSARFFNRLQDLETSQSAPLLIAGIGGEVGAITVETSLALVRDDGELITVRGAFGVFTKDETADLSILGRDVTNNFSVIYDYPGQTITLIAPPHNYEIRAPEATNHSF